LIMLSGFAKSALEIPSGIRRLDRIFQAVRTAGFQFMTFRESNSIVNAHRLHVYMPCELGLCVAWN